MASKIGGTVGDIESTPFLEAIRQVAREVGKEHCLYIHVTLIPYLSKGGEMKTKPTQHSVKELLSIGIQPDVIVCRTEHEISQDMKDKLALFCNVDEDSIIQNMDAESLYEVPLMLEEEGLANVVCRKLSIENPEPDMTEWIEMLEKERSRNKCVRIALVGKYVELHDAYLSVVESLYHGGIGNGANVKIQWVNAEELEQEDVAEVFKDTDGILVPGGFGDRGIEGKIIAIQYAREHNIPFLGICLGMQCAVIEFARNVLGWTDAFTSEVKADTTHPVIDLMPEQKDIDNLGGTMRLGAYPCKLAKDSLAYKAYGEDLIYERHRHRYEFNNEYRNELTEAGLQISGLSPDERLVEIVEVPSNSWHVGVQFHPEFKSRPNRPHPLFRDFIAAALQNQNK